MKRTAAVLTSIALLAACGGSDDSSSSDSGDTGDAAESSDGDAASDVSAADATTFSGELEDGSILTVRLDVAETDPVIAPFVEFRSAAGATDDVVWIVGSLEAAADYDDAGGPPTGRFLTFVAPGAELISDTNPTSDFACGQLDDWFGTPSGEEGAALNEQYIAIVAESCNGQTLGVIGEVGATTDYAMVVAGTEIPAFDAIYAGLLTELTPVG